MNPLESQLAYPFGDTIPTPGSLHEIVPGLRWARRPYDFRGRGFSQTRDLS